MLEDRVVFLTHARHSAGYGAAVVCHDEEFTDAAKRNAFENEFPGTIAVAMQEPEAVVGAALDAQGRIDALISTDAVPAVRAPVDEADTEEMRRAMEALVIWPYRLVGAAVPAMKSAGQGKSLWWPQLRRFAALPIIRYMQQGAARAMRW